MKNIEEDISLAFYMFGEFKIFYNNSEVALGRNSNSKFLQLLQMILLNSEKGMTKEELIGKLYNQDIANSNNSFNNLIYQFRKQMVHAGLPDAPYIVKKHGRYFLDEKVDASVDVNSFLGYARLAKEASNDEDRYMYYEKAVSCYTGAFLPEITNEQWVEDESDKLKSVFSHAVSWLIDYCNRNNNYCGICRFAGQAADIYPDCKWQIKQINALISQKKYDEAYKIYDKTARFYTDVLGIRADDELINCYRRISSKIEEATADISIVQDDLNHSRIVLKADDHSGAYDCTYPGFIDCYNVLQRNMIRTGNSVFMMLCTVVDYEGKSIHNQKKLAQRSADLDEAIMSSLRNSDVFCRYSSSQFLILLAGTSREDTRKCYKRISDKYKAIAGSRAEFNYQVVSLAELPDKLKE